MSKFFLDTEFHEYQKQPKVAGIKIGKPIDTIELISIGIVSEDISPSRVYTLENDSIKDVAKELVNKIDAFKFPGREYYAICKEFDIKAAWNANQGTEEEPNYWLRENVLKPIWKELQSEDFIDSGVVNKISKGYKVKYVDDSFNFKYLIYLIENYGKTKQQIAEEVLEFCRPKEIGEDERCKCTCVDKCLNGKTGSAPRCTAEELKSHMPEFYAYYGATDWVNFYRIFDTKLLNLPKGFPWFYNDLKPLLDTRWGLFRSDYRKAKEHPDYPKQDNEHNALDDAKWNKKLYKFINKL